jgi:hypothetical protein
VILHRTGPEEAQQRAQQAHMGWCLHTLPRTPCGRKEYLQKNFPKEPSENLQMSSTTSCKFPVLTFHPARSCFASQRTHCFPLSMAIAALGFVKDAGLVLSDLLVVGLSELLGSVQCSKYRCLLQISLNTCWDFKCVSSKFEAVPIVW